MDHAKCACTSYCSDSTIATATANTTANANANGNANANANANAIAFVSLTGMNGICIVLGSGIRVVVLEIGCLYFYYMLL